MEKMPWLPVEEDGRLNDPVLKENFITRIYCLNDFYESMGGEPTRGKIVEFHSRYKLTLMAQSRDSARAQVEAAVAAATEARRSQEEDASSRLQLSAVDREVASKSLARDMARAAEQQRLQQAPRRTLPRSPSTSELAGEIVFQGSRPTLREAMSFDRGNRTNRNREVGAITTATTTVTNAPASPGRISRAPASPGRISREASTNAS